MTKCSGGIDPGFDACPKCGATMDDVCKFNIVEFATLAEANAARQKEWDVGNQIDASYRANELAGELGESVEAVLNLLGYTTALAAVGAKISNTVKKLERERMGIRGSRATIDQLADELGDLDICQELLAQVFGINRAVATARKFNATSEKVGLRTRMVVPK